MEKFGSLSTKNSTFEVSFVHLLCVCLLLTLMSSSGPTPGWLLWILRSAMEWGNYETGIKFLEKEIRKCPLEVVFTGGHTQLIILVANRAHNLSPQDALYGDMTTTSITHVSSDVVMTHNHRRERVPKKRCLSHTFRSHFFTTTTFCARALPLILKRGGMLSSGGSSAARDTQGRATCQPPHH